MSTFILQVVYCLLHRMSKVVDSGTVSASDFSVLIAGLRMHKGDEIIRFRDGTSVTMRWCCVCVDCCLQSSDPPALFLPSSPPPPVSHTGVQEYCEKWGPVYLVTPCLKLITSFGLLDQIAELEKAKAELLARQQNPTANKEAFTTRFDRFRNMLYVWFYGGGSNIDRALNKIEKRLDRLKKRVEKEATKSLVSNGVVIVNFQNSADAVQFVKDNKSKCLSFNCPPLWTLTPVSTETDSTTNLNFIHTQSTSSCPACVTSPVWIGSCLTPSACPCSNAGS